jgi:hypothetical protein
VSPLCWGVRSSTPCDMSVEVLVLSSCPSLPIHYTRVIILLKRAIITRILKCARVTILLKRVRIISLCARVTITSLCARVTIIIRLLQIAPSSHTSSSLSWCASIFSPLHLPSLQLSRLCAPNGHGVSLFFPPSRSFLFLSATPVTYPLCSNGDFYRLHTVGRLL